MFIKSDMPLDSIIISADTFPEEKFHQMVDGFDQTLQNNYLSHTLLLRMLYPSLCKAQKASIVFVASEAHRYLPHLASINSIYRAANIIEAEDLDTTIQPLKSVYSSTQARVQHYANTRFLQVAFARALRQYNTRSGHQNVNVFACTSGNLLWEDEALTSASWKCWWWLKLLRLIAYPLTKTMVGEILNIF